jgi:twitching motility protein PilT
LVELNSQLRAAKIPGLDQLRPPTPRPRPAHAAMPCRRDIAEKGATDLSYRIGDKARFRVNVFRQGVLAIVMRVVPMTIPTSRLGLPAPAGRSRPQVHRAGHRPTGSGKKPPRGHHRPDQRTRSDHPHHRGPHRVQPQAQEVHGAPARLHTDTPTSRWRSARAAPGKVILVGRCDAETIEIAFRPPDGHLVPRPSTIDASRPWTA